VKHSKLKEKNTIFQSREFSFVGQTLHYICREPVIPLSTLLWVEFLTIKLHDKKKNEKISLMLRSPNLLTTIILK
jgi:hypothetical protein